MIAKLLSSHTSVYSVHIATTASAWELLYMAGCYASPGMMNKSFISIWGWMQVIGRRSLVPHISRMKGKEGKDDTHPPAPPVRMSYPVSHPLTRVHV